EAGFIAAGNAPEDVAKLIWLFLNYRDTGFIADAVRIWDATDPGIDGLVAAGERLDTLIRSGTATPEAIAALTVEVETINRALDPLQQQFADALAAGFAQVRWMLYGGLSVIALLLLA